jgi:hypothetical protein
MASRQRTPEDVRHDIEREREQLVRAVTDFANVLLRKLAIGAATAVGTIAALKLIRRRSH